MEPKIDIRITSRVSAAGTEFNIEYAEGNASRSFDEGDTINFVNNSGINTGTSQLVITNEDWYDAQTLGLTNSTLYWKTIAPKPIDNATTLTLAVPETTRCTSWLLTTMVTSLEFKVPLLRDTLICLRLLTGF